MIMKFALSLISHKIKKSSTFEKLESEFFFFLKIFLPLLDSYIEETHWGRERGVTCNNVHQLESIQQWRSYSMHCNHSATKALRCVALLL